MGTEEFLTCPPRASKAPCFPLLQTILNHPTVCKKYFPFPQQCAAIRNCAFRMAVGFFSLGRAGVQVLI